MRAPTSSGRQVVLWLLVLVLLVPAALLTFARLAEPEVGFWIQAEAFAPVAIVLYATALVLLVARLALRRWRAGAGGAGATAVAAALALAGLCLHAWWFAPQVVGADPPPGAGAEPVTVMTANLLKGEADGAEVVREATEEHVDLLVVEEVTPAELADMDRAGLDDLLPHRVGEPRSYGDGTMVFSRAVLGAAHRVPTLHDGWVVDMGGLTVLAVHPYAPTVADGWVSDHAAVTDAVERWSPDLVVGDLNATADHAPMRELADEGYRDVGELANEGWQPTWPSGAAVTVLGIPVPALAQIDHVLVGARMAALSMHTLEIPGSDHRAVVAEVATR